MKRKPIQMCVASEESCADVLYVLCDDGTMWSCEPQRTIVKWAEIYGIPDSDEDAKDNE